jgi:hypothetical protein
MGRPPSDLDEYLDWQERLESFQASGLEIDVFCLKEGGFAIDLLSLAGSAARRCPRSDGSRDQAKIDPLAHECRRGLRACQDRQGRHWLKEAWSISEDSDPVPHRTRLVRYENGSRCGETYSLLAQWHPRHTRRQAHMRWPDPVGDGLLRNVSTTLRH